MPAERLSMRKLREFLRLHFENKLSARAIARSIGISASTAQGYVLKRFRPSYRVCAYRGPSRSLDDAADVTVTSYALLRLDQEELKKREWAALVLDEAQAIKNPDSQVASAAFSIPAKFRVALLEESPKALVIMSGTFLIEPVWRSTAKMRAGLRLLQSHGTQDPLLAFTEAEALRDLLLEEGLKVGFVPFQAAHTIAPVVLHRLGALLTSQP